MPVPLKSEGLSSIQVIRCFACLLVVLHHAIRLFTVNAADGWSKPGLLDAPWFYERLAVGVDIFFVLSGFIMTYVATPYFEKRKPLSAFLKRRAIRIYPAYWVMTACLLVLLAAASISRGSISYDLQPTRVFASLILFPSFDKNMVLQPILGVGWTLSYEIYFYFLFAFTVALFRYNFLFPLSFAIISLIIFGQFLPEPMAIAAFLRNPIAIEFLFGCALAKLYSDDLLTKYRSMLMGVTLIAIIPSLFIDMNENIRFILWGLPSSLFVACILSFEKVASWPRGLILIGDASYSIYLVHVPFLYFPVVKIIEIARLAHMNSSAADGLVIAAFAVAVTVGIMFYFIVERSLNSILRRF